ncbi:MAG: hypothetical protein ACFFCE_06645 [Promethearchaeota archaeon]
MQEKCLDCGADIKPGWDFCLTCGSKFADQMERTLEEQQIIDKKIKEKQKQQKKEFKESMRGRKERKRKEIKKAIRRSMMKFLIFLGISLLTGIIGFFIGSIYFDQGGLGFIIGFFTPLIVLGVIVWISNY